MELDRIYNMDCLEWMRGMADDSVDAIVTSPPYNVGLYVSGDKYAKRNNSQRNGQAFNKYDAEMTDQMDMADYYEWQCQCIDQMLRIAKSSVFYNVQMVTGNKVAVLQILGKYAGRIREVIVWDKTTAEPAMNPRTLNSEYELIIAFEKGDCKARQFRTANFERGTMSNIIRIGKNRENDHRAAFPLLLPQTLIHYFTNEGDIIADPFMGSATTAIAAIKEKRHFIGTELNKEYFDKAVKRIKAEKQQLRFF
jgi:DNA modification methylase